MMEFKNTAPFLKNNFLLENKTAERLYFEYAVSMPIIDYHNHLSPGVIAANEPFSFRSIMSVLGTIDEGGVVANNAGKN